MKPALPPFGWKQAIIDEDLDKFNRCKNQARNNRDFKIQFPQYAKEAAKDSPVWTELKKKITEESKKRQDRLERKREIMRR